MNNWTSLTTNFIQRTAKISLALLLIAGASSCKKDDPDPPAPGPSYSSSTLEYEFHVGQTVPSAPYQGAHAATLRATMVLQELASGNTNITITLHNTMNGETYNVHAHNAADPATTPNGTPYDESPNTSVFAQQLTGTGGSVSISQETTTSYSDLVSTYSGFFVVHDPLQAINTQDISTFLIVSSFARQETAFDSFDYDFNTGQVDPSFAYQGAHANTLSARIIVAEGSSSPSSVTAIIMNTMNGETYHTHSHDAADPTTTPNGTPYDETPNSSVFVNAIAGNGGVATATVSSTLSRSDITSSYEGFFVIHDPLQAVSTTDPTTFVILGSFAR